MTSWRVIEGDALERLRELPDGLTQTCITSPPYFGLRDYGHAGQIGLEATPDEYVAALVEVFREVRRVLRDDGTVWLNLGDSYAGANSSNHDVNGPEWKAAHGGRRGRANPGIGVKHKDLLGIPWMVAFALRADGWYLRSDIIWAKPNPMPESVTDRPTKAHEYLFLLSKSPRYYWDADAIAEEGTGRDPHNKADHKYAVAYEAGDERHRTKAGLAELGPRATRNRRSVWTVPTQPFPGAHFAVFPPKLIEPCILAGSAEGDTVLDPFAGAGTTGLVATRNHRSFVGVELNPAYAEMARQRIRDDQPLMNYLSEAAA